MIGLSLLLTCLGVLLGCLVYQLLRQNGRILLRLESLEQRLAQLQAVKQPASANVSAQALSPSSSPGLPIGSPAPAFELPSLSGERVTLSQFRGQRLLLTFFNPQCGFCAELVPALSQLSAAEDAPVPVVVTRGDPELNRRFFSDHEIKSTVLLQGRNEVAERYRASGTPAGYLIDENGRIASALALGGRAVLALGADAVPATGSSTNGKARREHQGNLPLSGSKIKRDGLPACTPAPDFRLMRVDDGELALSDYRGWRVLLVFSDPHCGPCSALALKLEAIHNANPDLRVLMVSRGDPEENRQKVTELGLTFPVVLQKQWEISRAYGMFATPIGYLIDERGVIARAVAVGEAAILAAADEIDRTRRSAPPPTQEAESKRELSGNGAAAHTRHGY